MNILKFIEKWMGELLILSIIIGYFIPGLSIFKPYVSGILMFLLFSSFLQLELSFHKFFRKELLIYPIMNWILMPVLVFYLTSFLDLDYRMGLLLIIITPPALGAPIIVRLTKGDMEFVVSNVVIFNIISPLVYAFMPGLLFKGISEIDSPLSIFTQVALYIFIPLILALILRRANSLKTFILTRIDPFKGLLQLFMIAVVVASSSGKIRQLPIKVSLQIFTITLIISFIMYLTGYLACKKNSKMQFTCPVATGHKNTILSIVTCLTNFSPIVSIPSIFYLISHHIWNGLLILLANKTLNKRIEEKVQIISKATFS